MTLRILIKTTSFLRFILTLVFMLVMFTCLSLALADLGFRYQSEIAQFRIWMKETWLLWLLWRLMLYSVTGWGDMALLSLPRLFSGSASESSADCCCFCWFCRDLRIFSVEVEDDDIELS